MFLDFYQTFKDLSVFDVSDLWNTIQLLLIQAELQNHCEFTVHFLIIKFVRIAFVISGTHYIILFRSKFNYKKSAACNVVQCIQDHAGHIKYSI